MIGLQISIVKMIPEKAAAEKKAAEKEKRR